MTNTQLSVGAFVNIPEGVPAVNTQLTQNISFWNEKVTAGAHLHHLGCFPLLVEEGELKLKLGPLLPPRCSLSTQGVYNAHQPGFPLHLLEGQLQKAGVSGD